MLTLTDTDFRKIEAWLKSRAIKDSQFPNTYNIDPNDTITIVHNDENKKVSISTLSSVLGGGTGGEGGSCGIEINTDDNTLKFNGIVYQLTRAITEVTLLRSEPQGIEISTFSYNALSSAAGSTVSPTIVVKYKVLDIYSDGREVPRTENVPISSVSKSFTGSSLTGASINLATGVITADIENEDFSGAILRGKASVTIVYEEFQATATCNILQSARGVVNIPCYSVILPLNSVSSIFGDEDFTSASLKNLTAENISRIVEEFIPTYLPKTATPLNSNTTLQVTMGANKEIWILMVPYDRNYPIGLDNVNTVGESIQSPPLTFKDSPVLETETRNGESVSGLMNFTNSVHGVNNIRYKVYTYFNIVAAQTGRSTNYEATFKLAPMHIGAEIIHNVNG